MPDQLAAAIDIDTAVRPEHPDDHTVATQILAPVDVVDHRPELEFGVEEVAAARPDDREQLNRGVLPRNGDDTVRRSGATLMRVCTQLDPVGPAFLSCHARRQIEADDFQLPFRHCDGPLARWGRNASGGIDPNRPAWKSSIACTTSDFVFITNGP